MIMNSRKLKIENLSKNRNFSDIGTQLLATHQSNIDIIQQKNKEKLSLLRNLGNNVENAITGLNPNLTKNQRTEQCQK